MVEGSTVRNGVATQTGVNAVALQWDAEHSVYAILASTTQELRTRCCNNSHSDLLRTHCYNNTHSFKNSFHVLVMVHTAHRNCVHVTATIRIETAYKSL